MEYGYLHKKDDDLKDDNFRDENESINENDNDFVKL